MDSCQGQGEHEELWGSCRRALNFNVDVICRHPTTPYASQEEIPRHPIAQQSISTDSLRRGERFKAGAVETAIARCFAPSLCSGFEIAPVFEIGN